MMRLQVLVALALFGSVSGNAFTVVNCVDKSTCSSSPPTDGCGTGMETDSTKDSDVCTQHLMCQPAECCKMMTCKYTVPDAAVYQTLNKIDGTAVPADDTAHTIAQVNTMVHCADGKWTADQPGLAAHGMGMVTTCTATGGDFVFTGCDVSERPKPTCAQDTARMMTAGESCSADQYFDSAKTERCAEDTCTTAHCCAAKISCNGDFQCGTEHRLKANPADIHCAAGTCTATECCDANHCKASAAQITAANMMGTAITAKQGNIGDIRCKHCDGYAGNAVGSCASDDGDFALTGCTLGDTCTAATDASLLPSATHLTRTQATGCVATDAATFRSQFSVACATGKAGGDVTCGTASTAASGAFRTAASMVALIGAFFLY